MSRKSNLRPSSLSPSLLTFEFSSSPHPPPPNSFTMTYLDPLLKLGAQRPLTLLDIGGPSEQDKAQNTFEKVTKAYSSQEKDKKSIAKALWSGFGAWRFLLALGLYSVSSFLQFVPVLILNDLVKYFQSEGNESTMVNPWLEVLALFLVPMIVTLLQSTSNVIMCHAAVYVRTAVSLIIYNKIFKIRYKPKHLLTTQQYHN